MLFHSWAGVSLKEDFISILNLSDRRAIASMEKVLMALGVIHQDIRMANVLCDTKLGALRLIELERSSIIEPIGLQ